jgi:hypothetical protein
MDLQKGSRIYLCHKVTFKISYKKHLGEKLKGKKKRKKLQAIWKLKIWVEMKSFQHHLPNSSVWKALSYINEFYNQLKLEIFIDLQITLKGVWFASELIH